MFSFNKRRFIVSLICVFFIIPSYSVVYGSLDYAKDRSEFSNKNLNATAVMLSEYKVNEGTKVEDILFPIYIPGKQNDPSLICDSTPLVEEESFGTCSGVLVDKDIIATAGHCVVLDIFKREWVFNVVEKKDLSDRKRYKVKKVLKQRSTMVGFEYSKNRRKINAQRVELGLAPLGPDLMNFEKYRDIAFLQLDRQVEGVAPVEIDYSVDEGEELYMVGHPLGSGQKIAFNGSSIEAITDIYTSTNLDTFKGNSGSPVFSKRTNSLVGIMVNQGLDVSFGFNRSDRCYSFYSYSAEEKRKEHLSGMMTGDALRY